MTTDSRLLLMLFALVLLPAVFGASLSGFTCLDKCFEDAQLLSSASHFDAFRAIAVDIEPFCRINEVVLRCGRECPQEQILELEKRTMLSSYVCVDKVEEFRLARDCLVGAEDHTIMCKDKCGSLDGSVTVEQSDACRKTMCSVSCASEAFAKSCPGTGELYQDVIRRIVKINNDSSNAVPEECAPLVNTELFDERMKQNVAAAEGVSESTAPISEEFPPSNEPDIPIGPPQEGGTAEPVVEVQGQPETDVTIIDNNGRVTGSVGTISPEPSEMEASGEEEVTTMLSETSTEPVMHTEEVQDTTETVIVIDNDKEHMTDSLETTTSATKSASNLLSMGSLVAAVAVAKLI